MEFSNDGSFGPKQIHTYKGSPFLWQRHREMKTKSSSLAFLFIVIDMLLIFYFVSRWEEVLLWCSTVQVSTVDLLHWRNFSTDAAKREKTLARLALSILF